MMRSEGGSCSMGALPEGRSRPDVAVTEMLSSGFIRAPDQGEWRLLRLARKRGRGRLAGRSMTAAPGDHQPTADPLRRRGDNMPEGMNIEVAHKLSEHEKADRHKQRWEEVFEILEVLVLAIAAIATAWTGYQAARGDGHQSVLYGQSSRDRFQADAAS